MANLGNAWHIPGNSEPPGQAGMRDPVCAIARETAVTIFSGNQFTGQGGNPGDQIQDGSSLFFKRSTDADWTSLPLIFHSAVGNNKYYSVAIPTDTFEVGDTIEYYLRIIYSDHDPTFLGCSTTAEQTLARSAPFTFTVGETSAVKGQWGPVFALPNVGIHAHLLPNGFVLMWGRRRPDQLKSGDGQTLDVHECMPFLWDPATKRVVTPAPPQPTRGDGAGACMPIVHDDAGKTKVNLFCSGHAFLPDGRLLVAGGHCKDSEGLDQATIYDPASNTWTATASMNAGRWYPTATSLCDGSVLVVSGSIENNHNNLIPQVWKNGHWTSINGLPNNGTFELYPRLHLASNGLVFMTGPQVQTYSLDLSDGGVWRPVAGQGRDNKLRDYAPSVMYEVSEISSVESTCKVIYIGGGVSPTANAEIIDLSKDPVKWEATCPMNFPRRQHNATILPDGTVLVTGGTRGAGGAGNSPGFNDLDPGEPVHDAELWDPATGHWTCLAAEQMDRCYHATAVLLPDATVLSAGGGEYRPDTTKPDPNQPQDSHADAQIFSPPYLFKGLRPEIISAPDSVSYGETFQVGTPKPNDIGKVSWIRLSSVTHSFNANQRFMKLHFNVEATNLNVTAPNSPNGCPPGHYMLFILNREGVPSVAKIMQMKAATGAQAQACRNVSARDAPREAPLQTLLAHRQSVVSAARGTAVLVGITGTCPYGIGACWGGAHEALRSLDGVQYVDPIPAADNATATVFLEDERLPTLDRWEEQFRRMVNSSYVLRGVEVSVEGIIEAPDGELFLIGSGRRPSVQLVPLAPADKIQWDHRTGAPKPPKSEEADAYERLAADSGNLANTQRVRVTGPLKQTDDGYRLEVRLFTL
jgi:hypothetical protein